MNQTISYRRTTDNGVEILTVLAYIGAEVGDGDEIRVIHAIDGTVIEDSIAFHHNDGERWLHNQHIKWTADGYELVRA
jgi:hypothetical protein